MSTNNNNNQQQQHTAAAAAAAHINPFYIDPGELEKEWQEQGGGGGGDDYEWEDEYEAEGLISRSNSNDDVENNHHHHSRSSSPSSRQSSRKNDSRSAASDKRNNRQQQQQLPHVKGVRVLSRGQKRWICIIGVFALAIFFILSSTNNNNNNNSSNNKNNNNTDDHNHNNNDDGGGDILAKSDKKDDESNNHDNNNNNAAAMHDNDDASSSSSNNNNNNDPSLFVHRVVMLGERQTGVDAFRKHWADCFPTRNFTTFLTRKTYWFQDLSHPPSDMTIINSNSDTSDNKKEERILFVLLVRNPYTWVEAMRGHPLYMSAHVNQTTNKALSWQDFVTRPWRPLTNTETTVDSETTCQLDFAPNQVMPCHVPDHADDAHPADVYELKPAIGDGSGSSGAFANILALRAAKLQHFISNLPQAYQEFDLMATLPLKSSPPMHTSTSSSLIDNNVLIIHYEDDLVLSMQKLEQVTGWKPVETCRQAKRLPSAITLENLDPEFIKYLSRDDPMGGGLYWELENLIGYQKVAL